MTVAINEVLVVAGPTASGKSALGLALARRLDGVVINADSMQLYRDLSVLTARPRPADLKAAPHDLYGVLDGADPASAARWRGLAVAAIAAAREERRRPILVGGTGLYLKALIEGLSPVPEIPAALRRDVLAEVDREGTVAAHDRLAAVDPDLAHRLAVNDRQRIARALEVHRATGRPLSAWQAQPLSGPPPGLAFRLIVLMPNRAELDQAIARRLEAMVGAGAIAEVEALIARRLDPELPVMKAVGVPEFGAFLRGEIARDGAIAATQRSTRQYAKRQMTWLRHQLPIPGDAGGPAEVHGCHLIFEQYSERLLPNIFPFVAQTG